MAESRFGGSSALRMLELEEEEGAEKDAMVFWGLRSTAVEREVQSVVNVELEWNGSVWGIRDKLMKKDYSC